MMDKLSQLLQQLQAQAGSVLSQTETYIQFSFIIFVYISAYLVSRKVRQYFASINNKLDHVEHPIQRIFAKLGSLVFPSLVILFLIIAVEISHNLISEDWILNLALIIAVVISLNAIAKDVIDSVIISRIIKWLAIPIVVLEMLKILNVIELMQSISINIGNIDVSLYGVIRVVIFGSLLFWLGRVSNTTAKDLIRRQETLDQRTKEVASKLLEITIFMVVALLILQVMGINLTALAVFGGALGVGLGFGLQSIASNFISGIIILFDRSVSQDDYIELEDGRKGFVRELNMRSTTLETYDGKDIIVPNEKFIVERFTNWTHKNTKQRYQIEFSVAYDSNIRELVEIIKDVVNDHPQVISGDDIPIEEIADCEIAGFGESGINMQVEFWMEGVDDGKNRVAADLMLVILEALQQHNYVIPFPQRDVRLISPQS